MTRSVWSVFFAAGSLSSIARPTAYTAGPYCTIMLAFASSSKSRFLLVAEFLGFQYNDNLLGVSEKGIGRLVRVIFNDWCGSVCSRFRTFHGGRIEAARFAHYALRHLLSIHEQSSAPTYAAVVLVKEADLMSC